MVRVIVAVCAALSASSGVHAAMLMKIPGFPPADAAPPGYDGWYVLDSIQYSIDRDSSGGGTGGGTGGINIGVGEISAFQLSRPMGVGSTQLFQYAISGNSVSTVELRIVTTGTKSAVPTAAWRLDGAFVTSYSMSSSGGAPVEAFSLYFNKIAFGVVVDGEVSVSGWDKVTNRAWTGHGLDTLLETELGAAQRALPGDFSLDAMVDGRDFLAWQRGDSPQPMSAADLSVWKAALGAASTAVTTAAPEPTSWTTALCAWTLGSAVARYRGPGRRGLSRRT